MKNKKGFTLVELLIVIVILISILGIAIVSMNKISDLKKKEAAKTVENQVITAAKEYFTNNEYIFNSLDDKAYMIIPVNKLVKEDYLNILTNPETGEKISGCDRIKVVKTNNGLEYTYEKHSGTCTDDNNIFTLTVTNPDAPVINTGKIIKTCVDGSFVDGYWCKSDVDVSIGIIFEKGEKSNYTMQKSIDGIFYSDIDDSLKKSEKDKFETDSEVDDEWTDTITDEDKYNVYYKVENDYGEAILSIDFGIDKTAPELNVYAYEADGSDDGKKSVEDRTASDIYDETWHSGYVWVEAEATDEMNKTILKYNRKKGLVNGKSVGSKEESDTEIAIPGLVARKKPCSYAEGISIYEFEACDEAGNCSEKITKTVKLDRTKPIIELKGYTGPESVIETLDTENVKSIIESQLKERVNEFSWIGGKSNSIVVKANSEDALSGINTSVCTDSRGLEDFASWRRVKGTYEGTFTFNCTTTDNAGNKSTDTYVVNRDITAPTVQLRGYIGTAKRLNTIENDGSNLDSVIKDHLVEKTDESTWLGGKLNSIVLKASYNDGLSGVDTNECKDPRSGLTAFSSWRRIMDNSEGTLTFNCVVKDKAGNESTDSYIVKRDITPPTVQLRGYIGTEKRIGTIDNSNIDSVIKDHLVERTNDSTWIGGHLDSIVLQASSSDKLSGVNTKVCVDPRKDSDGNYPDFIDWRRVSWSAEGIFNFNCTATDKAGNESTDSYIVKRDITPPTVQLRGYIGTEKRIGTIDNSNIDSVIKDHLVERTNDSTWIGGHLDSIVLQASSSDKLSGVNTRVCVDPRKDSDGNYPDFIGWRRVSWSTEGIFNFNCTATDKAGNESKDSYIVKRDITPPKIVSFTNTKNTSCITSKGNDCYYSHTVSAADNTSNSSNVSGLNNSYKYNHCYDSASSDQEYLKCPPNFKSTGSKNTTVIYPEEVNGVKYGYSSRTFTSGKQVQHYTHESLSGYYNLFYKIYDKAGNSICYRYKLKYTTSNRYSSAIPTFVKSSTHCDDQ